MMSVPLWTRRCTITALAMGPTRTLTASDRDSAGSQLVDAQYLVIAFDCARPLVPPARLFLDVPTVVIGRGARRDWRRTADAVLQVELPDGWISTAHARIERGNHGTGGWVLRDNDSKNGTSLNGSPLAQPTELTDGDLIEIGNTIAVFRSLTHAGTPRDEVAAASVVPTLPSTLNPSWSSALATLLRVGRSSAPILLQGQTGTGKEVLARAVHTASGRSGPFVPVNCGAIVKTLVESELFGARKGAFSGATEDRTGLVRSADGGTLFLDEVAELPEPSQVALLRVLQERAVMPVGATRALPIDLRVVAATHEDLAVRVDQGRFRADLHSRLSGHLTRLPPLRDRIEDVGLLVAELLPRLAPERASRLTFARASGRALFAYPWPYNIRELEQALNTALAIATDDEIIIDHLPERMRAIERVEESGEAAAGASDQAAAAEQDPQALAERERIVAALEACAGNQTRTAKVLGISRATLVTKLSIHRLRRPRKLNR